MNSKVLTVAASSFTRRLATAEGYTTLRGTTQTAGVSRRRIIQGAAWATPAIVLATAVPAAANGSDNIAPTLVVTLGGTGTHTRDVTGIQRVNNDSSYNITQIVATFVVHLASNGFGKYRQLTLGTSGDSHVTYAGTGWSDPIITPSGSTATVVFTRAVALANADTVPSLTVSLGGAHPATFPANAVSVSASYSGGSANVTALTP
ncbi:hypothetical protein Lsed01_01501 [Demequina sediminis]|uniref:Tat pathway signal sequence domain protein n=1 Tax=Demequina sediminis TaxID=1930058 RepID=A0ABP9WIN6_9MICO|nr:hypothetical protein [Demequina sediminis]BDZ62729.1 hypothetical protein GCM10025873_25200 [Demequina sediminis]